MSFFSVSARQSGRSMFSSLLVLIAVCGFFSLVNAQAKTFNWNSITPSPSLKWAPCYSKLQCARLVVPLDYSNPNAGNAAVAIVMYPSSVPHDQKGYLGPILFNPGGPGGSGVNSVVNTAEQMRTVLGPGFDLIGFDPRGVGFTTPRLAMFKSFAELAVFDQKFSQLINASDVSLGSAYSLFQGFGRLAQDRMGQLGQYVGTPTVARDMLTIITALGADKLQYWGFSYGTILGATFATMFPDKVGRLVLDGVVDSDSYYNALWNSELLDTDKTLNTVYRACVDAGPLACPMHEDSVPKLHARVNQLLENLRQTPATFFNATSGLYGEVDYSYTKSSILQMLYSPQSRGKGLFKALAALEAGDPEPMFWVLGDFQANFFAKMTEPCSGCSTSGPVRLVHGQEVLYGIACSDGEPINDNVGQLGEYFDRLSQMSMFGDAWSNRMGCAGWKMRAKERVPGPLMANTSYPLLFIGNTADPVTPLQNARKMSQRFGGSVVLTQDSPGHCSVSAASPCTALAVRSYFQTGKLPAPNTVCAAEVNIFGVKSKASGLMRVKAANYEILEALRYLQDNYPL